MYVHSAVEPDDGQQVDEWPEESVRTPVGHGSHFLGFAVGLWLGPIGLGLAYLLSRHQETRKGAWLGLPLSCVAYWWLARFLGLLG